MEHVNSIHVGDDENLKREKEDVSLVFKWETISGMDWVAIQLEVSKWHHTEWKSFLAWKITWMSSSFRWNYEINDKKCNQEVHDVTSGEPKKDGDGTRDEIKFVEISLTSFFIGPRILFPCWLLPGLPPRFWKFFFFCRFGPPWLNLPFGPWAFWFSCFGAGVPFAGSAFTSILNFGHLTSLLHRIEYARAMNFT